MSKKKDGVFKYWMRSKKNFQSKTLGIIERHGAAVTHVAPQ